MSHPSETSAKIAAPAAVAATEVPWTLVNHVGEKMYLLQNHTYLNDRQKRTGKKAHVATTASTADFHVLMSEDYRQTVVRSTAAAAAATKAGRRIQKSVSDEDWVIL